MRVGILGCGDISKRHILGIRKITGVEIVGACDADEQRAREVAHRYGIRHVYREAQTMLKESHPDVVHVLTPPRTHKEVSIQAMEAGCQILVEKPMALNVKEADEMIAAARRHRVTLGVCHNHLFDPAVMEAKKLVAAGAIGRVIAVETFWRMVLRDKGDRPWLYDLPGGLFHEAAPHPVYLQMEFLRSLRMVSAFSKNTGSDLPIPSDELRVLFDGESGLGYLSISIHINPLIRFLKIYGTDMTLHVDYNNNTLVKLRTSGLEKVSKALVNLDHSQQLLSRTAVNTVQVLSGRRRTGHQIMIEKFYESLRRGTEPPVSGEDGRAVVAILDHIWAALAAG